MSFEVSELLIDRFKDTIKCKKERNIWLMTLFMKFSAFIHNQLTSVFNFFHAIFLHLTSTCIHPSISMLKSILHDDKSQYYANIKVKSKVTWVKDIDISRWILCTSVLLHMWRLKWRDGKWNMWRWKIKEGNKVEEESKSRQ